MLGELGPKSRGNGNPLFTISGISGLTGGGTVTLSSAITLGLTANQKKREVLFNLDGQGMAISAISGSNTWYLSSVPYNGTITGWNIVADKAGTVNIDVWKSNSAVPTVSNTITSSAQCSLSNAQSVFNGPITGWTTSVLTGDCFAFNLISAASITKANLTINISAT